MCPNVSTWLYTFLCKIRSLKSGIIEHEILIILSIHSEAVIDATWNFGILALYMWALPSKRPPVQRTTRYKLDRTLKKFRDGWMDGQILPTHRQTHPSIFKFYLGIGSEYSRNTEEHDFANLRHGKKKQNFYKTKIMKTTTYKEASQARNSLKL